ncbi:hypothetical protein ACFE04_004138 [Oxalis oulophora]
MAEEVTESPLRSDNKRKLEEVEPEITADSTSTDPDGVPADEAKRARLDGLGNQNGHTLDNSDEPANGKEKSDEPANGEEKSDEPANGEEKSDEPAKGEEDSNEAKKEEENSVLIAKLNEENEQQTDTKSSEEEEEPLEETEQEPEDKKDVGGPVTSTQQVALEHTEADIAQEPSNEENLQPTRDFYRDERGTMARKIMIPNNKVGVLIGKAGETIRSLQNNSGAKIQITKDADVDPQSTTRPVEIVGDLASIEKAEILIKAVIAEADAGGSSSSGGRGPATGYSGRVSEQIEMPVPNEKVGLIIGKGGETIKGLQSRSGARIQLIPQQDDGSQERTVRISGSRKQIEMASVMIKDVMNQTLRPSSSSGGFNQQGHRARGPPGGSHWGGPQQGPPPVSYDYHQRGSSYPSQNPRYQPPPNYGGYPQQQQMGPRSNYGSGWENRPPQSGAYDHQYSGHHGHHPASGPPAHIPPSGPVGPPPPSQANYNYGQPTPQGPGYGNPPAPYSHTPPQQNYGQGYDGNHAPTQDPYSGYSQAATQPGYTSQQQYGKPPPTYGVPQHGPSPTSYGPPRPSQPGDGYNQQPSYGSNAPTQPYPYASSGAPPVQQTYPPYGSAPAVDGYQQQPPASSGPGYAQQATQAVPGYTQPGGTQTSGYGQVAPAGGYGAYPMTQQGYTDQTAVNNGGYGYQQAPQDSAYNTGSGTTSAYGAPTSVQPNYGQPAIAQQNYGQAAPSQQTYDQSAAPQPGGYVAAPASASTAYGKAV